MNMEEWTWANLLNTGGGGAGDGVLWKLLRGHYRYKHGDGHLSARGGLGRVQESDLTIAFLASGTV